MEIVFGLIALMGWIYWLSVQEDSKPCYQMKMVNNDVEFKEMVADVVSDLNAQSGNMPEETFHKFAETMYLYGKRDLLAQINSTNIERSD